MNVTWENFQMTEGIVGLFVGWCSCSSNNRAEAAVVDHYFSSPAENIAVLVCLWIPGNRLMIVL